MSIKHLLGLSKYVLLAIVLAGLLVLLIPVSAVKADSVVTFPDPNLRAAIRQAIGKPSGDILQSDLSGITSLDAPGQGGDMTIVDLSGLEHCTALTRLCLNDNQRISDISPLSSLTSLEYLRLDGNQISDLSPLAALTNLTFLDLDYNQIGNLSGLAGLTSLTRLQLIANHISDISPLSGLTNLTVLYLMYNQISNISGLTGLTNLTWLTLWTNQISDISPLSGLTALATLDLGFNQISDISPLSGLIGLTYLCLMDNRISDISALAGLTSLTNLVIGQNEISDISPLSGLINLYYLALDSNQVSDIKPLVDNPGLSTGDLIALSPNPLSNTSVDVYIPQLLARGVTIFGYSLPSRPDQPTNISPEDGVTGTSLTPALQSSLYSDPDALHIHAASQWQVSATSGDYSTPVFDSGTDTSNLTSITLSAGILNGNTTYYWHVRYQDNYGAWSDYSAETSFTIAVAQVETATGTGTATLSLSLGTMQNLTAVNPGTLPAPPVNNLVFPDGMFSFNIAGVMPGGTVTVDIQLPSGIPANAAYWKYDSINGWSQIGYTAVGANEIAITLADDGTNGDLVAGDGVINDPGGLGGPGPSGGAHSAPVFPSIYVGIGAALGAGILAYFVRRRLIAQKQG